MLRSKWHTDEEIVHLFQEVGRALLFRDMEDSHSGNIALRFTDAKGRDRIAITATGSQKGDLEPEHICILAADRTDFGYYKASSETDIHARVLALEGVRASIHAHTKDLTIMTFDDEEKPNQPAPFVPVDSVGYRAFEGEIPVDWVAVPSGSAEMAKVIPERLARHPLTVIQGHGAFTKGRNLQEAFFRLCAADTSGYMARLYLRLGMDLESLRAELRADPGSFFADPPPPYEPGGDDRCDFPGEEELIREFRKAGARIFESRISPFHTGSLSVRGIDRMLYAPKGAMPRGLGGPLVTVPLAPDPADDWITALHKTIYRESNFQTLAHCWVAEAEVLSRFAFFGEKAPEERVVAIDAEGSFLYLVVPVTPPRPDLDTFLRLLHDYKVVIVRGGGVWAAGHQSLSEVLHHPASVREICLYRIGVWERGIDPRKLEPEKARRW